MYFYRVGMSAGAGELDREREEAVNQEETTTTEQRGGGETSETVERVDDSSKLGAEEDGCEATPGAGSSE